MKLPNECTVEYRQQIAFSPGQNQAESSIFIQRHLEMRMSLLLCTRKLAMMKKWLDVVVLCEMKMVVVHAFIS